MRAHPCFLVFIHLQPSLRSHNTLLSSQPIFLLSMTACTSVVAIKHHNLFQIASISFTSYSPFSQDVFFIHYFKAQFSIFPRPTHLNAHPPRPHKHTANLCQLHKCLFLIFSSCYIVCHCIHDGLKIMRLIKFFLCMCVLVNPRLIKHRLQQWSPWEMVGKSTYCNYWLHKLCFH